MNIDYVHTYLTAYSRKIATMGAVATTGIGAGGGGALGALVGAALAKKGRRLRGAAIGGGIGAGVGAGAGYGYSRYADTRQRRDSQLGESARDKLNALYEEGAKSKTLTKQRQRLESAPVDTGSPEEDALRNENVFWPNE